MELKTKINAESGKHDLTITREFDLPMELLYKAYTESEYIEQWMGTKVIKLDNYTHGSYQFETTNNGQIVFRAHGTFHEVIPQQKIIRTFEMENMATGIQLEFLKFEIISSQACKLSIQIFFQSEKHRSEQLKLPFAYGLNMAHNKLQELFNKTT